MGPSFDSRDETRADPHTVGTRGQRGSHGLSRSDAARGEDRNIDSGKHFSEQVHSVGGSADVTASLNALCDNEIATRIVRPEGLIPRSDLPSGKSSPVMDDLDQLAIRLAVEEIDDPGATSRQADAFAIGWRSPIRNDEIHTKRSFGARAYPIEHTPK